MRAYDPIETERIVDDARRTFGATHAALPWLPADAAARATAVRDALLAALAPGLTTDDGDTANGLKPHIGPLSPGCRLCLHGGWDCTWMNFRCTRNCYFCNSAADTRVCADKPPHAAHGVFVDAADHARYVALFNKTGVAFSGGEPLLRFDLVLDHLRALREAFGDTRYTWLYTNGDLVTRFVLRELAAAGLDEIRFDAAANGYDLAPVRLAKEYIGRVTVEIPCLPEHMGVLPDVLRELAAMALDHLNLHQLTVGEFNYHPFAAQGYRFLTNAFQVPVFESELAALTLMRGALDEGLALPINYCSKIYKDVFQERNRRRCNGEQMRGPLDAVTAAGYFRNVWVRAPRAAIAALADVLERRAGAAGAWAVLPAGDVMALHSDHVASVAEAGIATVAEIKVEYVFPDVRKADGSAPFASDNLVRDRILTFSSRWFAPAAAAAWQRRFLDAAHERAARGAVAPDDAVDLDRCAQFEGLPQGLPDVY